MFLTSIHRILKTSVISLWRNRWLSLAATLIMVLTLFTISFFVSLLVVIDRTSTSLKEKVDISVYFNETTSKDQIFSIQNTLLSRSDIKTVDYISKEKALEKWRKMSSGDDKISGAISETFNPLPRSLEIKTDSPENLESVNQFLSAADYKPLIRDISYRKNKDLVDRLVKITQFVKYTGWILSSIFVLIAVLIIYNTIRLTIYARSDEIEIMKLVGASDWHVQGPFIVEGISYGILASIISSLIMFTAFRLLLPVTEQYLGVGGVNSVSAGLNFGMIIGVQLFVGLILGIGCSLFAVRRHLK
jgi:cell division transport system permease protein